MSVFARFAATGFLASFICLLVASTAVGQDRQFDILILNGRVVDGTGNPWIYADIGINDDEIVAMGDLSESAGRQTIDATGLVVAPGFIDMHTHVDDGFSDPELSANLNYLIQGVTTVRPGADGSGTYAISELKREWEENGMGNNAVPFAPFTVIRQEVLGDDQLRSPTTAELARMKALVRRAMEEGAWGISAQLEYGGFNLYVSTEEVIDVSSEVKDFDGFYIAHIRDEASKFVEAVAETIAISEGAGIPVVVTHIKATGRTNWGLMRDVVDEINRARARGVDITADQYPFLQGAPIDYITALIDVPADMQPLFDLSNMMEEADIATEDQSDTRQKFVSELQSALRDSGMRERLRESTYEKRPGNPSAVARWGWQDFRIKVAVENPEVLDKNIAELIDEQGRDGFDIIADLVLSEPDMLFAAASRSPDSTRHAMRQPWVMISSDGGTALATGDLEEKVRAHPRSFASQAIALRKYVREEGVLTLEDAVRKMTSLPAQVLRLKDRGLLVEGFKADIAVFDPDTIQDNATYDDARQYATGVKYVIVNGKISIADGKFNGTTAGKVLLKH
jgi:N-acyl-D-aspartate/D-glutamate deacylase